MSDYTKLTNFAVKDGYTTGNPAKVIKGTEIDDEFNAISTAIATKFDSTDTIAVANGGTGATTAATARTNLGAAASGANTDITSLAGLTTALSVAQGGTGRATITSGAILLGNGTGAINVLTAGAANTVLLSNGTTASYGKIGGLSIKKMSEFDTITVSAADTYTAINGLGVTVVNNLNSTTSNTYVDARTITIDKFTGSMRFKATVSSSGIYESGAYMRILKNGVQVQEWHPLGDGTAGSNVVNASVDISIVPGDVIKWQLKETSVDIGSGEPPATISADSITASDAFTTYTPILKASEV